MQDSPIWYTYAMTMFTTVFWKDAAERAVSTAAQAALSLWFVDGIFNTDLDFEKGLVGVGAAAGLSVLKALAANYKGGTVSPASFASDH